MPGHKRNGKFGIIGSEIDITEIDGFDNLHNPKDCLLELEERFASIYNCKKSIISINGTTCGILAAISAICNKSDKIIIARNCHKSVYNACFINQLRVEYIYPCTVSEFNCFGQITQSQIDDAVKNHPDAKAIVITSPTYEGIVSSVESPIPLIVDCAHGAHFVCSNDFPAYPKADIVISSLHKTLPALTQSAVVNIYNEKYIYNIKKYMDIYETSSPSYVLLSSIEKCADFVENNKCNCYIELLRQFRNNVIALENIEILDNDDISRICIKSKTLNGNQLADILRNEYNIEPEMSCNDYVILISTVADDKYAIDMLFDALKGVNNCCHNKTEFVSLSYTKPEKAKESFEVDSNFHETKLDDALNNICAEYVYAYPPGIPILVPGEIIDKNIIDYINNCIDNNTNIISDSGLLPHKILTNGKV